MHLSLGGIAGLSRQKERPTDMDSEMNVPVQNAVDAVESARDTLPNDAPLASGIREPERPAKSRALDSARPGSSKAGKMKHSGSTWPQLDGGRYRLGDMVWAKVKSHPWWPGQIFDPALASSLARKSRREGHVLVAFFGDSTFGWFLESDLILFEPNFPQMSKQTTARSFLVAVEDALEEIGRRIELGLTCPCRNSTETEERRMSKLARRKGRGLNLERQIGEVRNSFEPSKMVAFVKSLACSPFTSARDMLWSTKAQAQAHTFRVAAFSARSSQYEECFKDCVGDDDGEQNHEERTHGMGDSGGAVGMEDVHKIFSEHKPGSEEADRKGASDSCKYPGEKVDSENSILVMERSESKDQRRGLQADPEKKKRRRGLNDKAGTKKASKTGKVSRISTLPYEGVKTKKSFGEDKAHEPKKSFGEDKAQEMEGRTGTKGSDLMNQSMCLKSKGSMPNEGGILTGRSEGRNGDLRIMEASTGETQKADTEGIQNCLGLSKIPNGVYTPEASDAECINSQVVAKKSMGFKRLVKSLKSMHMELKQASRVETASENESDSLVNLAALKVDRASENESDCLVNLAATKVDRASENESDSLGNLAAADTRTESQAKERKSSSSKKLQKGSKCDSGMRTSKPKMRPLMQPGVKILESNKMVQQPETELIGDKKGQTDCSKGEQREKTDCSKGEQIEKTTTISPLRKAVEGHCTVQEQKSSHVGCTSQDVVLEEHQGNHLEKVVFMQATLLEAKVMQVVNDKNSQPEKMSVEANSLEDSRDAQAEKMEVEVEMGKSKTQGFGSSWNENDARAVVSCGGSEVQPAETINDLKDVVASAKDSSSTQKEAASLPPKAVVKKLKESRRSHGLKFSQSSASANENVLRKRVHSQKDANDKKLKGGIKRLKTGNAGRTSEDFNNIDDGTVDDGTGTSKLKSEISSVILVPKKVDGGDKSEHQSLTVGSESPDFQQLLRDLVLLAANPFYGIEGGTSSKVLSAFAKFREVVFQSGHGDDLFPADQDDVPVSAPASVTVMTGTQESEQPATVTQVREQLVTAAQRGEQPTTIAHRGEQLFEAEASKAEDARPEVTGARHAGSKTRKRTLEDSSDGPVNPVKNSKKPALLSTMKKISPSSVSLRPTTDIKIPVHISKDGSNRFGPVSRHSSKLGTETDKSPSGVNRVSQDSALLMKFPQGFALPSEAQLRATFVRFGPLILSGTRIYCSSGGAQVVYRDARDAEAALKYVKENNVFGQALVSFRLRQFPQTKDTDVPRISFNVKESKSMRHEERLPLSTVDKQDSNVAYEEKTLMSTGNHIVSENHLQVKSRSPLPLKSCLKKMDSPMSSTAKNGARVTFQLSCGVDNAQSMRNTNTTGNTDQVVVKSSCEKFSGMLNDSYPHVGSASSSPHLDSVTSSPLLGPRPSTSFGLPVSNDIGEQMMTLLQKVSALVGSSGIVL